VTQTNTAKATKTGKRNLRRFERTASEIFPGEYRVFNLAVYNETEYDLYK